MMMIFDAAEGDFVLVKFVGERKIRHYYLLKHWMMLENAREDFLKRVKSMRNHINLLLHSKIMMDILFQSPIPYFHCPVQSLLKKQGGGSVPL